MAVTWPPLTAYLAAGPAGGGLREPSFCGRKRGQDHRDGPTSGVASHATHEALGKGLLGPPRRAAELSLLML